MAYETRGHKRYYYKKKREGKKVVSIYVGTGPEAEKIAQEDERFREKRKNERQFWQSRIAEIEELDKECESMHKFIGNLINANFILAGYHKHKGEWRRRRDG